MATLHGSFGDRSWKSGKVFHIAILLFLPDLGDFFEGGKAVW